MIVVTGRRIEIQTSPLIYDNHRQSLHDMKARVRWSKILVIYLL